MAITIKTERDGNGHAIPGRGTRVYLDDQDISGYVAGITVDIHCEDVVRATLDVYPSAFDIDLPEIPVGEELRRLLITPSEARWDEVEDGPSV